MFNSKISHSDIESFANEKVNLKDNDLSAYRTQAENLKDKLDKHIQINPDFGLIKMINSGSVAKGTALKTINDMDIAVYLKQPIETKEDSLLIWLTDRLKEAYPNLNPDQFSCPTGSHCVTISFRGTGLDVDVVPVIEDDDVGDDYGYLVTKDTGERVLTNIPCHIEFIRKRKSSQPKHFGQVVRLIKWWVQQQKISDKSFRFKSLMVELICASLADGGLDMSDYPGALQEFFKYIIQKELKELIFFTDYYDKNLVSVKNEDPIKIIDPVNPINNVASSYTEQDKQKIIVAATDAFDALTEAQYATTKQRAIDLWKVVFGPSFT